MIDSHCHLDHEPLFSNIKNVIKRSKDIGLTKILTICTTSDSFKRIIELVDTDPIIYGTFGIHPHESETDIVDEKKIIHNIQLNKKIIGVGETGLDFFYNHSDKNKQTSNAQRLTDEGLPDSDEAKLPPGKFDPRRGRIAPEHRWSKFKHCLMLTASGVKPRLLLWGPR